MNGWTDVAEHLGIPMAILAAFAWAVWHWVNQAGAFIAPRVDKVVDATVANSAGIQMLDAQAAANHAALRDLAVDIRTKVDAILRALEREANE